MILPTVAYIIISLLVGWSTMVYCCYTDVEGDDRVAIPVMFTLFWPLILPLLLLMIVGSVIITAAHESAELVATKIKNKR